MAHSRPALTHRDPPYLTGKEREVLRLTDGRPMREIAAELGIGLRTVKQYSDSLRRKYGVKQRWELTQYRKDAQ